VDDIETQVNKAVNAGGRILTGGKRLSGKGNYFEPTVIAGVPGNAAVCREEFFGPVALLFRAADAEEAIAIANDSPFGLAASVWTHSKSEQTRFAKSLQCGAVFFNEIVASDPRLPFGGVKHSGYGRELSAAGMREFLNAKTVVVHDSVEAARTEPAKQDSSESGVPQPILPVRSGIPSRPPRIRIKLKQNRSSKS
jgi:succinate-semialdehyde dehydrogenase/glutarate-semialdehyde dehydrogenase